MGNNLFYFIFCLLTLSLGISSAQATDDDYPFPYDNPLLATVISVSHNTKVPHEVIDFEPRPDRRDVPLAKKRNVLQLGLFRQKGPAPLVFVIAGLGGSGAAGSSYLLGGQLYQMGYHVVTLPDPFSWQYVVARSESALPGYMPSDASEYYIFLQEVFGFLTGQKKLQVNNFSVVGYSLGGILSGFLAKEDDIQHVFNFKKVVIINPAIDVRYGLEVLDKYYFAGARFTRKYKNILLGAVQVEGFELMTKGLNPENIKKRFEKLKIRDPELKWLIGQKFREELTDVIFNGQQVHDLGILKAYADDRHRNARTAEAATYSFTDYLEKFVLPNMDGDPKTLIEATSLYSVTDTLKNNMNIFVMENEDDFLIREGDIDYLKATLGNRLYLYPLGGHIGNLSFPKNQDDLKKMMLMR